MKVYTGEISRDKGTVQLCCTILVTVRSLQAPVFTMTLGDIKSCLRRYGDGFISEL